MLPHKKRVDTNNPPPPIKSKGKIHPITSKVKTEVNQIINVADPDFYRMALLVWIRILAADQLFSMVRAGSG